MTERSPTIQPPLASKLASYGILPPSRGKKGWRCGEGPTRLTPMNRLIPALAVSLALTACTAGPGMRGRALPPKANPSAVIATELAFARLAQEKGQWSAFRATAAKDAEMFVPQRVLAQDWLRGRADPATSVKWQPTAVWSSCDGSYAVTRGNWQSANASGGFVTVWQRQGNAERDMRRERVDKPEYKWVLDMSVTTEHSPATTDAIEAKVADCGKVPPPMMMGMTTPGLDRKSGYSTDGTLRWYSMVSNGTRQIEMDLWNGNRVDTVLKLDGRDTD
jgi:hypothetical protein